MGSRSTYRSSVPLSAAHGVTRPVVGQMFHVKHWLLCRWCSRRRRALLWGRGAVCAGGRWPAREPSVPRVVVGCALVFWAPEAPAAREIATREPAARSGRSRSPHVPSGPSGALHTRGAWALMCGSTRRLVVRPGPAAAHRHRDRALRFFRRPPHRRHLVRWLVAGRVPPPPIDTATVLRVVGLPISSARSGTFNSGGTIALPDSTSVYGYEVVNQNS